MPNIDGTLAVYTVSTYNFESHSKTSEIRAFDIRKGQSTLITNDGKASEPKWLGIKNELLWLQSNDDDEEDNKTSTRLIIGDADQIGKSYIAATIPGKVSDVRLRTLGEDRVAIAFNAKARPDGTLFNPGGCLSSVHCHLGAYTPIYFNPQALFTLALCPIFTTPTTSN